MNGTPLNRRAAGVAFTLIELLVVISIIALLMGILLPALGLARRGARDAKCNINVRQIVTAMFAYTTDNGEYPRGLLNNNAGPVKRNLSAYAPLTNPFAVTIPSGDRNDVGVAIYLLLHRKYVTSSAIFVSPGLENHVPDVYESTGDVAGQITFSNFGTNIDDKSNLSYGYTNPYFGYGNGNGDEVGPHKLRPGNRELTSDYVIVADRGPGCCTNSDSDLAVNSSSPASRSNIHLAGSFERGQHVAYADGHALWSEEHMVGPWTATGNRDNIFFGQAGGMLDSVPRSLTDNIIYPILTADR